MLTRIVARRWMTKMTLFQWFPKTFPNGEPQWKVDTSLLRKEYRQLQAQVHPDVVNSKGNNEDHSAQLNKAYHILSQPLARAQYLIKCVKGVDLTNDEVSKQMTNNDPILLSNIIDVHESLTDCENENEIAIIRQENNNRLKQLIQKLDKDFECNDYDKAISTTVELKYWTNLAKAINEWTPGSRFELHH
ncbi:hypothetical protein RI543_000360 [Arxiozyma heterogenica]|uniref:J domain-containing protein n=1 Tax=Arxiozyma heterogenica TaxID=278026 RepID=A0AAN7WK08_9SACH|nr:hypothetical protein RI543_000360 [Kazachstania heterogenica]